jgi:hypothetical protein
MLVPQTRERLLKRRRGASTGRDTAMVAAWHTTWSALGSASRTTPHFGLREHAPDSAEPLSERDGESVLRWQDLAGQSSGLVRKIEPSPPPSPPAPAISNWPSPNGDTTERRAPDLIAAAAAAESTERSWCTAGEFPTQLVSGGLEHLYVAPMRQHGFMWSTVLANERNRRRRHAGGLHRRVRRR